MNQPQHVEHYPAEKLTFEMFADAPYDFICPDGDLSEMQEVEQHLAQIYTALRIAMIDGSEEADSVLGCAIRKVAEARGAYWDQKQNHLMLKERYQ